MPYVTESNLTDLARERWSNIPDPRLREVMTALVKHVHAFVREIEPTEAEWATAIDWLTRTGKMCTDKRQEFILFSDVLGVSMLIDTINHRFDSGATPTTVEGPFHVPASPEFADGADMARNAPGVPCFVTGLVRDLDGKPIAGASSTCGRPTARATTKHSARSRARGCGVSITLKPTDPLSSARWRRSAIRFRWTARSVS
jgi:hydroxyquinol 1,2-dioxygenase